MFISKKDLKRLIFTHLYEGRNWGSTSGMYRSSRFGFDRFDHNLPSSGGELESEETYPSSGSGQSFTSTQSNHNLPLGKKLSPSEFKRVYGPIFKESVKGTPLFASVKLAQFALETGWGESTIGRANNLFGIKGRGSSPFWNGEIVESDTEEVYNGKRQKVRAGFRKYDSPYDSINDHTHLLTTKSIYRDAMSAITPEDQAIAIHKAGYATGTHYSDKLIQIINDYNFKEFDEGQNYI